jgi:DNA-binding GntR family transcriptional regulator
MARILTRDLRRMQARDTPAAEAEELLPIERSSLGRRATELIRRAIVNGTLAAGTTISLREVAARLGVSATPVREALIHLNAIGLVEFLPGRVQIASPTPVALREAFELREGLEGAAARLAAERRTAEQAGRIADLAARSFEEAANQEAFQRYDLLFHRSIGEAAASAQIERYLANALDLALTLRNLKVLGKPFRAKAAPMHVAIAEAIAAGDGDAAERLSREHVRTVYRQITEPRDGERPVATEGEDRGR